jgi:hypothetical protein
LCTLISAGKAYPSRIISHELSLDEAPTAYEHFDKRDKGWTKVILKPGKTPGKKTKAVAKKTSSASK